MNKDQKLKAQQVRDDYLKQRAQRHEQEGLKPADIVDAFPGDADGLLPLSVLGSAIKLKIPAWAPAPPNPEPEVLVYEWKHEAEEKYTPLWREEFPTPINVPFPLERVIDAKYFTGREGRFSFRYGVRPWNDNDIVFAADQPITIDRTPIYDPDDPPAVEDPGPVNDSVLVGAGGVVLTIPDFVEEKKDFVRIAVVWAFTPPPADLPIIPNFVIPLPADRKVLVDRAIIEALPSGDHHVAYELFDKAGNRSRASRLRTIKVALGPLPETLLPPFVPLAPGLGAGDDLIDLEDAHTGVYVEVPRYDNHHHADRVVVKWGTLELPGVPVGVAVNPFPVEVPINWAHLKAQYTSDPNTQATPVTYKIVRGTTDFPLAPADAISVNVNFGYTGPENPDEPNPVNPDLDPVIVRGDSGGDNHLIDTDNGKPATATLKVYDPPLKDDLITLYWNGVAVADTVTLDAEVAGAEVTIDILWSEIAAEPSAEVPVYYTVSHPRFANDQFSQDTTVKVDALPITLDKATFPDLANPAGQFYILNCDSLRKRAGTTEVGYRVSIPPSQYLVAGQKIDLRWVLKKGDGITEVVGSELVSLAVTIPVDADVNGMDWFVTPYSPHIYLAYDEPGHWANAEVIYTLTIAGQPVSSQSEPEIVGVYDLSTGLACDITNIPEFP